RRHPARSIRTQHDGPCLEHHLCPDRPYCRGHRRAAQLPAVPHHPPLPEHRFRSTGRTAAGGCDMAMIVDLAVQGLQMALMLLLAPLLTGIVRKFKARLMRRQGPPVLQPYRDLLRLMRKDVVLADNAS